LQFYEAFMTDRWRGTAWASKEGLLF